MTGRMVCAGVVLLVLALLQVPGAHGQQISLAAAATGQQSPYNVYFAEGESTQDIGTGYLPTCTAPTRPGQVVTLEKEDGSLWIAKQGPLSTITVLQWDTIAHPTLTAAYNGTYVCRINTFTSAAVYHLHVVQRLSVTLQPSTLVVNDTGEKYSIMASVSGVFPISINWTSSAPLATQEPALTSFSFLSNDSGVSFGVPFTVDLTVQYQPAIPCAGSPVIAGFMLRQSVIDNCSATAMPTQATATITVHRTPCPAMDKPNATIIPVPSAVFGTNFSITCIEGHGGPMPSSIQCLTGGEWSAEPECSHTATVASSALDTGAIAGIAVGGAILMALIAGLIIYFAVKRDSCARLIWRVKRRPSTSPALSYCPTAPPSTLQKDGIPASEDDY